MCSVSIHRRKIIEETSLGTGEAKESYSWMVQDLSALRLPPAVGFFKKLCIMVIHIDSSLQILIKESFLSWLRASWKVSEINNEVTRTTIDSLMSVKTWWSDPLPRSLTLFLVLSLLLRKTAVSLLLSWVVFK